MKKIYCSLGLMSGTSADGVDASIINSDGDKEYEVILNKYFKYNQKTYENIHSLKEKINSSKDLKIFSKEIMSLEKEITLFHANVVDEIIQESKSNVDFIGFHGQTIFHNSKERISKQLGDGKILSQLTKKIIVCNFRENDLNNGGEGAPLAPIFHKLIINQHKISLPVCVLNIGGIANITAIERNDYSNFISRDIGPGNCLIDEWIRKNTKKKYDDNGLIAKKGKTNEIILNQAFDNFNSRKKNNVLSFDTKDFNLNFALGLSLEEGAATLTDFTGRIIGAGLFNLLSRTSDKLWKVLVCGGGRKNTTLMNCIKKKTLKNIDIQLIDDYGIDGDFVESQAFAYLAIRSYLKLPISFPETTGCKKPCIGGEIIKNF
jgi:anhydro-N-acetylmuramic acid kinase|tara:strand:+ start:44 stop:1171 length:1128 start_codon:yes stop_codon:yes gene_type:complete